MGGAIEIYAWQPTDIFEASYLALDDSTRSRVLEALAALKDNPLAAHLDLRPLGTPGKNIYTIRVDGLLRLSFKYIEGIAELRQIALDEVIGDE